MTRKLHSIPIRIPHGWFVELMEKSAIMKKNGERINVEGVFKNIPPSISSLVSYAVYKVYIAPKRSIKKPKGFVS